MNMVKKLLMAVGRALFSLVFILAAIQKIFNWSATEQSVMTALCDWMSYAQGADWMQSGIETILAWVPLIMVFGVVFELLGGILIFLGIKVRLGAFLLILVLIPATLLYNNFWMQDGDLAAMQAINFLKNLSLFGALLVLLAIGSGKIEKEKKPSGEK